MRDLADGESVEVQGSARAPYVLRNTGGVYSCSCPAWRNQSLGIEKRTCKHLKALRGEEAELARVGSGAAPRPKRAPVAGKSEGGAAPPVLLAHSWHNDVDLTHWWMSEKLDGVRAWWDGKTFWSRQGNEFLAPKFFVEDLPGEVLDGELWLARQEFQRAVSIVRRQDRSEHWAELTYVVFDAPEHPGPFEERLEHVAGLLKRQAPKHARAHPHAPVRDVAHLKEELARVEALGGEGLMLRKPGSKYEAGRSTTLLKVKSFKDDEAEVVGHLAGAGRHHGRLGALEAKLRDGTRFAVGTGFSDAEREAPPPIGSIITVRFQELSKDGVPRFPSYVGVRIDHDFKAAPRAPAAPKAARKPGPGPLPGARRFELVGGSSQKFWEVSVDGAALTVRFGRLGTQGQAQQKSFASPDAAQREADRLVAEKTGKGYQAV